MSCDCHTSEMMAILLCENNVLYKTTHNYNTFQANNNTIDDWNNVQVLEKCKLLNTVYLEHNPVQVNFKEQYRRRLQAMLPKLIQIDSTYTRLGGGYAPWLNFFFDELLWLFTIFRLFMQNLAWLLDSLQFDLTFLVFKSNYHYW